MTDISWDFATNDITFINGNIGETDRCSEQNGGLMMNKSAANIQFPNFGVGFEDIYANLPEVYWGQIQVRAQGMMLSDYYPQGYGGNPARNPAVLASVRIYTLEDGVTTGADIRVRYRTE